MRSSSEFQDFRPLPAETFLGIFCVQIFLKIIPSLYADFPSKKDFPIVPAETGLKAYVCRLKARFDVAVFSNG